MKLLIATPCYGGQITANYFISMTETIYGLVADKIPHAFYTLANESLINRARNRCAQALLAGPYDTLLFIDADLRWKYSDVRALLRSERDIIGGTYPVKDHPIQLNFNPIHEQSENLPGRDRSPAGFSRWAGQYSDSKGEVEVRHIPTGFLRINRSVFEDLKSYVPTYYEGDTLYWDFFPTSVRDGVLESEDWGFCSLARDNGHKIHLQTKVILGHIGSYEFKVDSGSI